MQTSPHHHCHHHWCLVSYKTLPPLVFPSPPAPSIAKTQNPSPCYVRSLPRAPTMVKDAPPAAPVMMPEEMQAEAELRMRDISQRFRSIPEDHDEVLWLLEVSVGPSKPFAFALAIMLCSCCVRQSSVSRCNLPCNCLLFFLAIVLCSHCVHQSDVSRCSLPCNCLSFWGFFFSYYETCISRWLIQLGIGENGSLLIY